MPRTTISELENDKRKYVSTAELAILPWALDTAPPLCFAHRHIGTRSKYCRAGRQRVGQRLNGFQVLVTVPGESRWQTTSRPMPAILRHCAARISELTTQKQRLMEALVDAHEAVQAPMLDAIHGLQDDIDS